MILPIITYCSPCWFFNRTDIERIENLQRRVTKRVVGSNNPDDYPSRLKLLNLLPIGLYTELCDFLALSKVLCGFTSIDWTQHLKIRVAITLRSDTHVFFVEPKLSKKNGVITFGTEVLNLLMVCTFTTFRCGISLTAKPNSSN